MNKKLLLGLAVLPTLLLSSCSNAPRKATYTNVDQVTVYNAKTGDSVGSANTSYMEKYTTTVELKRTGSANTIAIYLTGAPQAYTKYDNKCIYKATYYFDVTYVVRYYKY